MRAGLERFTRWECDGSLVHVQFTEQHDDQPESSSDEDEDEVNDAESDCVRLGASHDRSFLG